MGLIKNSLIGAAIGLLGMAGAQASAIYNWQPLTGTDDFSTIGGRLILSDNAFESSHAEFSQSVDYDRVPADTRFPDSDIVSVSLDILNPDSSIPDDLFHIQATPTQGRDANSEFYSLDADIDVFADLLTGGIDLLTIQDQFSISSDRSGLWTVNRFGSDAASESCFEQPQCSGATGRWRLAEITHNVSAPAVWPLFALAVLALSGALFSRKRFGRS